jgi:hypothetical protein
MSAPDSIEKDRRLTEHASAMVFRLRLRRRALSDS